MNIFKRLFCKHAFGMYQWHFSHGWDGTEPRYIEGIQKCMLCGKKRYFWVERNSSEEKMIMDKFSRFYKD